MYSILDLIFQPIVWVMSAVLELYIATTGSTGISILLLGITLSAILAPLRLYFERKEKGVSAHIAEVKADIAQIDQTLKGEDRFNEIEKVYQAHGYHPIQNLKLIGSFAIMIPTLVSAIFLFADGNYVAGIAFGVIENLADPDGLLGVINVLPFLMLFVTFIDSFVVFRDDRAALFRFLLISGFIFLLVYGLSAALLLYWIGSNLFSLSLRLVMKKRA